MVRWSSWTPDRKQFIWITHDCGIGGCSDWVGVFMTIRGQFPKYKKIAPLWSIGEYTPTVLSNTLLTLVEKFWYDGKLLSKAIIHSFNLKNGSHF
jgi:hypothetical protein